MKKQILFIIGTLLPIVVAGQINTESQTSSQVENYFDPAATPRIPVIDTYFGMKVTDKYRWMEDMKDPKVLDWLKAQNDYTQSWLNKIP